MGLKEAKVNFIIDVAKELFLTRSISLVTIKDIANEAEVGEMTIYRYFGKKQNIVLAVVLKLQNEIANNYFKLENGVTGFEKISIFYNSYLDIFLSTPSYYQFIREFDSYMLENSDSSSLKGYEDELNKYKEVYISSYELGLKDKSIKKHENIEMFYYASTHSLLELCKKLSVNEGLLSQDQTIEKKLELKTLIDIFLNSLKNS